MPTPKQHLRVAILRNFALGSKWTTETIDSLNTLVKISAPNSQIDVYSRVDGDEFPDPEQYDLIILTGGTVDVTLPPENLPSWVNDTIHFIQSTLQRKLSVKFLGLCWGHHVINHALGGTVVPREKGTLIDVEDIALQDAGKAFFQGHDTLALHKFHKRVVSVPALSFIPLAEENEILMSVSGQFLTFQGHPELNASIARDLIDSGDPSYFPGKSPDDLAIVKEDLMKSHDGAKAFSRVMEWVVIPLM